MDDSIEDEPLLDEHREEDDYKTKKKHKKRNKKDKKSKKDSQVFEEAPK